MTRITWLATILAATFVGQDAAQGGKDDTPLPPGVKVVWDLMKASREATGTRERICLNGLWRWQPAKDAATAVPADAWGYFKVPAFWPGRTSYIQEDCQALYAHSSWKNADLRNLTAAWYEREIMIPANWTGRRIAFTAEYVNSFAVVYLDGKKVDEIRFPAGEVDVSDVCRVGQKHMLSLLVVAMPLKGVLLSYTDSNSAREVKGTVERRGLCGDLFLTSTPRTRITDIKIDTSYRKGELTISTAFDGLFAYTPYTLTGTIYDGGIAIHELTSKPFKASDLKAGRVTVTEKFKPAKLWDLHTPGNVLQAVLFLRGPDKKIVDGPPRVVFGFREFWIDGKDFYLNGSRIHLSAVPLDNAQVGARTASYYWGARDTLRRLKSLGINFVYTHNYGCEPGSHISFNEILTEADNAGMLVAFSQPHFAHYDWKAADADKTNGYARHAEFYVRQAQNHPSVIAYSMSHNATGYDQDMNPDLIDGIADPRKDAWSSNNAKLALRAEAIVKGFDPSRIAYHHSSGNLGSMHTMNFYLNFAPIQEVSDWFEHWANKGVKPVFPCEYGVPFTWDWTMYRGWYKGERAFGSAKVPWEFCQAEWSAQFLGDHAFALSEQEKKNLRWEAEQFKAGKLWHRWEYPTAVGSSAFNDRQEIIARYLRDNWRAHRTWGISANSPWEYAAFFQLRDAKPRPRQELKVDYDRLQQPGFSPDYYEPRQRQGNAMLDLDYTDWLPTASAFALMENNQPLLAYIGGKADNVTGKGHNYFPGDTVEKQLIIINDSRVTAMCDCEWSFGLPTPITGKQKIAVPTGDQQRLPLRFEVPADLKPGNYTIKTTVRYGNGQTQRDDFTVHVLPRPVAPPAPGKVALFDPKGHTAKLLAGLKVPFRLVDANADLSPFDVLIIGREALTTAGSGPDVSRVRDGLKVLMFEQTAKVLEQRFGFRIAEYGLRQVFPRVADHPLLAGVGAEHLRDWQGEATLLSPRLDFTVRPRYGPTVKWCDIEVPRVWRCGCRGNVASVLIEKPARGDFLPIIDGGYSLQYSPLLEYREGKGMVLFCQLDVTDRSETDPAPDIVTRNLLGYLSTWKPRPIGRTLYAGNAAGKKHLEASGMSVEAYTPNQLAKATLLIVGPGGGRQFDGDAETIGKWLKNGGHLLALGIDEKDAACLPVKITLTRQEHIGAYLGLEPAASPLAGVSPGDLHSRDPHVIPLVTGGATTRGNSVLAMVPEGNIVICQHVPWDFATAQMNHRRTFRRASCLVSRLAANLGAAEATPLLSRVRTGVDAARQERRWLDGFYLDTPEEWDDPYRYFRW